MNSFPTNELDGTEYSGEWLYQGLASYNSEWLTPEAMETFSANGFYSVRPFPGFKLINVNNNFGAK